MNLWSTRTASQTWLASELQVESEFLDQGFNLLQECIYNYNVLYKTSSSSEPFIEVSAYTTLKAHHLLLGIYSLSFDGLSQESGALLRPLVETYEMLVYIRLKPSRAADVIGGNKPSAGEIAKDIGSEFHGLRKHLNSHASHLSFEEDAIRHLKDEKSGSLIPIPIQNPSTFLKNLSTIYAFIVYVLFECVSCLGSIGVEIEDLANRVEKWKDEGLVVFERIL